MPGSSYRHIPPEARRGPPVPSSSVNRGPNLTCFPRKTRGLVPQPPSPFAPGLIAESARLHPPLGTASLYLVSNPGFVLVFPSPLSPQTPFITLVGARPWPSAACLPLPLSQHRAKAALSHSPRTIPAPRHSPLHPLTPRTNLATSLLANAAVSPLPQAESGGAASLLFLPSWAGLTSPAACSFLLRPMRSFLNIAKAYSDGDNTLVLCPFAGFRSFSPSTAFHYY